MAKNTESIIKSMVRDIDLEKEKVNKTTKVRIDSLDLKKLKALADEEEANAYLELGWVVLSYKHNKKVGTQTFPFLMGWLKELPIKEPNNTALGCQTN